MSYYSLAQRVPERSAMEPKPLARLYAAVTRLPMMRAAHRRFVAGVLAQGVAAGTCLDLGTGPGYVAVQVALQRPGLQMVGLDLAAHMAELAKQRAARAGLDGQALWPQADGHILPFADDSFDLVVSSFALHHWSEPVRVLDEIARVLRRPRPAEGKPGGRYYITDLSRETNLLQQLFAYGSIPAVSLLFGSYGGYGGYYESVRAGYTRDEAQALLARSKLSRGEVRLESTWLMPIVTIASEVPGGTR
jgi:ubiquinone/menaquinone biosynthesis C-methylase UbiE